MSSLRERKVLRQKRLREVGARGQARLAALHVRLRGSSLRSELALRYLLGAGVASIVGPAEHAALARALDASVLYRAEACSEAADALPASHAPAWIADPALAEALAGTQDALALLRANLPDAPR